MERPGQHNSPCNYCQSIRADGNCTNYRTCDPYKGWLNASWEYWRNKLGVKGKDVMK